jgi:hypothetical protein
VQQRRVHWLAHKAAELAKVTLWRFLTKARLKKGRMVTLPATGYQHEAQRGDTYGFGMAQQRLAN